jgi:hypothetical protein
VKSNLLMTRPKEQPEPGDDDITPLDDDGVPS